MGTVVAGTIRRTKVLKKNPLTTVDGYNRWVEMLGTMGKAVRGIGGIGRKIWGGGITLKKAHQV